MTRQEFEEALVPLTLAEKYSKINPHVDYNEFLPLFYQVNYNVVELNKLLKNSTFFSQCNILPEIMETENYKSPNIAFMRNDRYYDVPVHSHGYIEMNYVFSGNCTAMVNDKTIHLSTGDICIMDRNVSHRILPTGEKDIVLYIMLSIEYFSNSFINALLDSGPVAKFLADVILEKNDHNQYLMFHTAGNSLVKELIESMIIEYLNPGICCATVLHSNLTVLFVELARSYQGHMERKKQKRSRRYLTEILSYMEQHSNDCTLTEVAKQFNFTPNYLSRMLKYETSSNFQDILCECKMKRAAFLLSNSEIPIYKIANECGYQNQSFFRQKFVEVNGQSPAEYRKSTVS